MSSIIRWRSGVAASDRFIQQAVMQVLQADWDRTFSEASFGFRPGRSAHQAVARAQALIASGHGFVVDIELEKFFDRVNHDILMGLVAKRVTSPSTAAPWQRRCCGRLCAALKELFRRGTILIGRTGSVPVIAFGGPYKAAGAYSPWRAV
jgi:hypothetical protein